jgi:hypothetical protein
MYLNQSLIGEVAGAQHADRLREASAARRARQMRPARPAGHLRHAFAALQEWAGRSVDEPRHAYPIREVETTVARCLRETPPAPESPADLDEALVQQLLAGYAHPVSEPPPGTSYQAEWLPDHQSNPYLRDAA